MKDTSGSACYPVLCGHCLPSCQTERQAPGLLVFASKRYISLKSLLNPFKHFLNFLLSCPHKRTVLDFEILSFWFFRIFFFVFVNMGPFSSQNFKTLLLRQLSFESFQTFSEFFFSVLLTKVLFLIFKITSFFFQHFLPFRQRGTLLEPKLQNDTPPSDDFWIFSTYSWIFSIVVTKVLFWIFEILMFRFLTIFLISPWYPMGKAKTSIIWKTSERRAKQSESWASSASVQCIQGPFDS